MRTISWERDGGRENYYITNLTNSGVYRYPRHIHRNHWELVYCAGGTLIHYLAQGRLVQRSGELILIRDGDAHSLRSRGCRYTNLAFRADWIGNLAAAGGFGDLFSALGAAAHPPALVVPPEERPELERLFASIPALRGTSAGSARATALILDLLVRLFPAEESGAELPGWLREGVEWARGRERVPSLTELAARCGYSREHLSRTFTGCLGCPPGEWLRTLRLERCCALLRHTNYSVADIIEQTGFPDSTYFYRLFKQSYGLTPGAYRRRYGMPYILPQTEAENET